MTPNLPACERCGTNSWDGSEDNPRCPFCRKFKKRGSREEMAKHIHYLREVVINTAGFLGGMSILTVEQLQERIKAVIKETE